MGRELKMVNHEFTTDMLDRFIFATKQRETEMFTVEKPLTAAKAMEYIGIGRTAFHALVTNGVIKPHYFEGLSTPFYFPSEIYETLKKS